MYKVVFITERKCSEKGQGGIGYKRQIEFDGDRHYTNLTSIYCSYQEKIVKHNSYQQTLRPHKVAYIPLRS